MLLIPRSDAPKSSWWGVIMSVLAAFFGVQTRKNYQHDFASGRYWPYIFVAVLVTLIFIGGVYLLVQFALSFSAN
ncbi:MAG: DUF2970 domain-containing protein [Neptuniibacter sp.]